jgi:eukaryotic-like serine/threonine-protein kinase
MTHDDMPTTDMPSAGSPASRGSGGAGPGSGPGSGSGSGGFPRSAGASSGADRLASAGAVGLPGIAEGVGSTIGSYRLLQLLGEGGFGEVYLAEQRDPVIRRVAVKVIKLGMESKEIVARFEAERQALAMMDHPGVARFFDSGMTERGRPFFAMEFVPGVPITDYCDRMKLTTRERLQLFIDVCEAVQHAHQKGIIHRDLKPSNILVSDGDGRYAPKVIDFGIAKAVSGRLTERTLFTEQGRLIGTPEYMSPEQAGTTGVDVDTRTDIYSLGVVLYQLLIGALPFDPTTLRSAGYAEILRIIREVEPPRLSVKLSKLGAERTEVSARRQIDPDELRRQLQGDLDWITMRAMDKDRNRRYQSCGELATDIRRYLNSEPVIARPPSVMYNATKFVRRHRVGVAASAGVAACLVMAVIGTSYGMVEARAAEGRERDQKEQAVDLKERAEAEARKREAANRFLADMLRSPDPMMLMPRDVQVQEVLRKAAERVGTDLKDQPEVEAVVRAAIGRSFLGLGLFEEAEPHLRAALELRERVDGAAGADTAESRNDLALLRARQGKFDEADRLGEQALEARRAAFGPESVQTASSLSTLALARQLAGKSPEAEKLYTQALEIRRKLVGPRHADVAVTLSNLAVIYAQTGRDAQAEQSFKDAIAALPPELAERSQDAARYTSSLGEFYRQRARFDEAEPLLTKAVEMRRAVLGDSHPDTGKSISNLALLEQSRGRLDAAERLAREALNIAERTRKFDLDIEQLNYANILNDRGRPADAEPIARAAMAARDRRLEDPGNREHGNTRFLLGRILTDMGRAAEGEPLLRRAVEVWTKGFPVGHFVPAQARSALGANLLAQGKLQEAEPLIVESFPVVRKALGDGHLRTRQGAQRVVDLYEKLGRPEKAGEAKAVLDKAGEGQ